LLNEFRVAFTQRQGLSISHGVNSAAATSLALPGVNPDFFPGVDGPRLVTADASLIKKVPVLEGQNLELRLEALNVFNHASLGNPNTQFGSPNFGVISSLQSGGIPSRTLQLAAHFTF
jgi:hypothetical protein